MKISEAMALARAQHRAGRLDAAADICRRVLAVEPNEADALHLAGAIAHQLGRYAEAIGLLRRAIAARPDAAEYHNNLGLALGTIGQLGEAVASYGRALALRPDMAAAHNNLGMTLRRMGRLDESVGSLEAALRCRPDFAGAHVNLGIALEEQGLAAEAAACYRRALEIEPDWPQVHSHLLHVLNFCPGLEPRDLLEEHRRWNARFAAPLAGSIRAHANDRSPERRLRVGYVSPDFRLHPVGRFLVPLWEAHDRAQVEVFGYSSVPAADGITERLRARADAWREVAGLDDRRLAELVRQDRIDVLVDLTMHMEDNRLLVFARKPAPVQVTYLAYVGTTGLDAIDYRLTDPYLDPPGAERHYREESVRLPETYWCYQPGTATPEVGEAPAPRARRVTFGCLNHFCKASPAALAVWAELLGRVPGARLLLHAQEGAHRQRTQEVFARAGVAPERVEFAAMLPAARYFELYGQIDVALDPFPYGGGTTTCDALWMGVPVVTLAGPTGVGRGGVSILSNLGLEELIARDARQYVAIAAALAGDNGRLSRLRGSLRARMQSSVLMDAPRFARNVEAAYRQMWRRWCAG